MPRRLVCRRCEVLFTGDANEVCFCCDGPMADALGYVSPASSPMSHPILALIANEVP